MVKLSFKIEKLLTKLIFCRIIIIQRVVAFGIMVILKVAQMERCQQKCEVKVDGTAYFLIGGK